MSESSIINEITRDYMGNQKSEYAITIYGVPLSSLTRTELEALLVKFHGEWQNSIQQRMKGELYGVN